MAQPLLGLWQRFQTDARYSQLVVLSSLLLYGRTALDFVLPWLAIPVTIAVAWSWEAALFRFRKAPDRTRPPFESATISSLSLMLILRSNDVWVYAIAISVAILSKTLIRYRGRHFINPTNGAVMFGAAFLPAWITSGQWGYGVLFIFCIASAGYLVLTRAGRLDSAVAFIGGLLAFGALRILVFGFRWPVLWHLFENGALWLFALYMITDPRTTPQVRAARYVHGALVALLALVLLQFFYVRDSFLWALLALAPTVPLADALWPKQPAARSEPARGGFHVQPVSVPTQAQA